MSYSFLLRISVPNIIIKKHVKMWPNNTVKSSALKKKRHNVFLVRPDKCFNQYQCTEFRSHAGHHLDHSYQETLRDCASSCCGREECLSFTWQRSSRNCWIFKNTNWDQVVPTYHKSRTSCQIGMI